MPHRLYSNSGRPLRAMCRPSCQPAILLSLFLLLGGCRSRSMDIAQAVSRDDMPAIRRILHHNPASVNARDHDGFPVVYLAASRGYLPVVKLLVGHGAKTTDKRCGTLTNWAAWCMQPKLCQYLHKTIGQKIDVYAALAVSPVWKVYDILKRHPDIAKHKSWNGEPVLEWATGRPTVMWMLIERGADVNALTGDGHRLVWYFACGRHLRCLKVLLDAGANPFCRRLAITPIFPHFKEIRRLFAEARARWRTQHPKPTSGSLMVKKRPHHGSESPR